MRRGDERGVVVPAQVGAPLVVVEPELALQLLVVELDLPAQPGQAREPLWLFAAGQVGEPVVGWRLLAFGPLADQPLLARLGGEAPLPAMGGAHPHERKAGAHRLTIGPIAERHALPVVLVKPRDQLRDRLRPAIGAQPAARAAAGALAL